MKRVIEGILSSFLFGCIRMFPHFAPARCLHNMDAADLLERDVVPLDSAEADVILKGRVILVTGAAGSIGSELCRQLLQYEPALVIALDTNETGLFDLAQSLHSHPHASHLRLQIGDIKDVKQMSRLLAGQRPYIVFHAAAYKHVPLLEQHPGQAIRTNALATYHLCLLARENEVARFVYVSTDKEADPASVLGASKRVGEIIVQSLARTKSGETSFCAVRFGNVIGSRGSVVPVFASQIERGGPVTVTDPEATRYFMTIPEACGLVILTASLTEQGGLYLLDMGKPVRIVDLATKMIRLQGLRAGQDIPIVYTGLRPGERLHEILVGSDERLTQTAYHKILSIHSGDIVPPWATISQWMCNLEECLQDESDIQLRERLFEIVQKQMLIAAN